MKTKIASSLHSMAQDKSNEMNDDRQVLNDEGHVMTEAEITQVGGGRGHWSISFQINFAF
ncbi:MAG: hypothetical protein NTX45_25040 [Proteobacteria bacterium]|nr:hypothetical protein [Pseudomonadota bacterium]